jgi:acyl-CoA thioesterase-2
LSLAEVLDLKETGEGGYLAAPLERPPLPWVFGGQFVAQALAAAARTVPEGRLPHSVHAHFLHSGEPAEPIGYQVTPLRDGRAQNIRQVLAQQGPHDVFTLTAAFAGPASGPVFEHQVPAGPAVDFAQVPPAEVTLADADPRVRKWFEFVSQQPVEIRFVGRPASDYVLRGQQPPAVQQVLVRAQGRLPDDPVAQGCGLAYLSDLFLLTAVALPHGYLLGAKGLIAVSLDHAIWFHGPVRSDEWLLFEITSSWAGHGRGLCQGRMYDATGRLVASVLQEGLVKPVAT